MVQPFNTGAGRKLYCQKPEQDNTLILRKLTDGDSPSGGIVACPSTPLIDMPAPFWDHGIQFEGLSQCVLRLLTTPGF